MRKPTKAKLTVIILLLSLTLALGPGCQEPEPPPSPEAVKFQKKIQAVINRIAPPLIEPVAEKDMRAVQKELVKTFSLCAEQCEGIFYNVFILNKNGVLTAVYPPAEVQRFQFSNYKAVQKAFTEKKPNQTILYQPDGTATYIICVPLIQKSQVVGILALGFEGENVRQERGVSQEEFLHLKFQAPEGKT
jgi:hypothetical protein